MRVPNVDGHGFERLVGGFAACDVDPKYVDHGVHKIGEGVSVVRSYQQDFGWNPRRPHTSLARCMFNCVGKTMGKQKDNLLCYLSLGTALDYYWGIDFWFECGDRIVTVDLTLRFKVNFKAHYVLTREHFLRDKHYGIARSIGRKLSR